MKEVGTDLNSSWPTDEQMKWAKEVLNTDSYSRAQEFLKEIQTNLGIQLMIIIILKNRSITLRKDKTFR